MEIHVSNASASDSPISESGALPHSPGDVPVLDCGPVSHLRSRSTSDLKQALQSSLLLTARRMDNQQDELVHAELRLIRDQMTALQGDLATCSKQIAKLQLQMEVSGVPAVDTEHSHANSHQELQLLPCAEDGEAPTAHAGVSRSADAAQLTNSRLLELEHRCDSLEATLSDVGRLREHHDKMSHKFEDFKLEYQLRGHVLGSQVQNIRERVCHMESALMHTTGDSQGTILQEHARKLADLEQKPAECLYQHSAITALVSKKDDQLDKTGRTSLQGNAEPISAITKSVSDRGPSETSAQEACARSERGQQDSCQIS